MRQSLRRPSRSDLVQFQFFNKINIEKAQFYIIKNEPDNLMTGYYWEFDSFHLFIVLDKDVYMFSFCYYS